MHGTEGVEEHRFFRITILIEGVPGHFVYAATGTCVVVAVKDVNVDTLVPLVQSFRKVGGALTKYT